MDITIRLAKEDEIEEILEVENRAGRRFNAYGLGPSDNMKDEEDDDEEEEEDWGSEYHEGVKRNRLWVAITDDHQIVGFALAQIIDQEGHLRELDVLQDFGRKGIGRALIDTVIDWCDQQGFFSITLTTFKDIPWNRPYYEKLGFQIITCDALKGQLKEMIEEEQVTSKMERVAMRKQL